MDKAFAGLTWRIVSVYVDDICVYADSFTEFLTACEEVFTILSNLGITLKAKKCYIGFHSLELLGYLVDRFGITTTANKSEALRNIAFPVTLAQLEYFIGLVNWNRHLIPFFSQRLEVLQRLKTQLLRGAPVGGRARKEYAARTPIVETEEIREAFDDVKGALADRPRLYHFDPRRPTYAFVDSSKEYGCGLAVYQLTGDPAVYEKTRLVPLHFMSRELTGAERRYWPTDMEMSGLVWAVRRCGPYLEQAFVTFVTDHQPAVDLVRMKSLATTSTARSSLRLQTWSNFMGMFQDRMKVVYAKGSTLACPDALSRLRTTISAATARLVAKASQMGAPDRDTMEEFEVHEGFSASVLGEAVLATVQITEEFRARIVEGLLADQRWNRIRYRLLETTQEPGEGTERLLSAYEVKDKLLYFKGQDGTPRLILPTKELQDEAMALAHNETHAGLARSYALLSGFYWRGMGKDLIRYIRYCPECLRNKPSHHKPYGALQPILSPNEPFDTVNIDIVTDLPEERAQEGSTTFDSILTVTDRYSKAVKLLPGRKDWGSEKWAEALHGGMVLAGWGYPATIISDRDRRFLSALWQSLFKMAGVQSLATAAYHPAADGQAERTNQTIEVMLRFFVGAEQKGWVTRLPFLEVALNNMPAAATGLSPNEMLTGKRIRLGLDVALGQKEKASTLVIGIAERREVLRRQAEDTVHLAREAMARAYDNKHSPIPVFESGWAFLRLGNGYNLPSIKKLKLAPQKIGPFKILSVHGRGRAFALQFPKHFTIHNVISVTHLEPAPAPDEDPW